MSISVIKNKGITQSLTIKKHAKCHSLHQLAILRRIGQIGSIGNLNFHRAATFRELKKAYALNYRIFLENDYIEPNFSGMRIREWELSHKTATFIAKDNNRIIGLTSLAPDSAAHGLPSDWLYTDVFDALRSEYPSIAEACNGAVDAAYHNLPVTIEFYRCLIAWSWFEQIDVIVGVANKNHKTFYEFLYFNQIGPERNYSRTHHDPVIPVALNCHELQNHLASPESDNDSAESFLREFLYFRNPYRQVVAHWKKKAEKYFIEKNISRMFREELNSLLIENVFSKSRTPVD